MTDTIATLLDAHANGKPLKATIEETYDRIGRHGDPALFITLRSKAEALAEAKRLQDKGPAGAALFGVPFAVKDNIDVSGLPTTAACPAFAYTPTRSAFVVERLERAGAIVIGKTNLDQFATGLVGTRSPYGVPRNALRADLIPGGSSSGSAVAVGAGLIPFSLGTDTAGSGRVPAALNGIVGIKPSLGALSASGMVPACQTLDTISSKQPQPSIRRTPGRGPFRRRRGRAGPQGSDSASHAAASSNSLATRRRKRPSRAT
jgi:allophanate hydrolase